MPLTHIKCKNAAPKAKAYKMFDEKGLYLEVTPRGGKYWRYKYRFAGKEKRLAIGVYPEISLSEARSKCDEARRLHADGVDPAAHKRACKAANLTAAGNSFAVLANEWFERNESRWASNHAVRIKRRLDADVLPHIGREPVSAISSPQMLTLLRRIEDRGAIETAHRVKSICSQVFRYAIATARAQQDPTIALKGALRSVKVTHHASITEPKAVGQLMRAISGYQASSPVTYFALRLLPYVFLRSGELRKGEWKEIDFERCEWRIPAARMKMREPHIVPLSKQSLALLQELHRYTGNGILIFPQRSKQRPMSENTINAALRRLGYSKDEMTGHGFRSTASTLLNEQGWTPDAIERQLAHCERNGIRAAYNYAQHLPERKKMMQAWADYLDSLHDGWDVTNIQSGQAPKTGT